MHFASVYRTQRSRPCTQDRQRRVSTGKNTSVTAVNPGDGHFNPGRLPPRTFPPPVFEGVGHFLPARKATQNTETIKKLQTIHSMLI